MNKIKDQIMQHLAYRPMPAADLCRFLGQGAAVMDALAELEADGTVGSRLIGNSLHYFDAVRPPAEPATGVDAETGPEPPAAAADDLPQTGLDRLAAFFRARPGRLIETTQIAKEFSDLVSTKDCLTRLKKQGLIDNPQRGYWQLRSPALVKQPRALPADQAVVPPMLPQVANADEKPYWAEEINVGGFSDGSFVIRKAGGRNEMTLSRAQMLRVVGFVNQFLAMEA